MMAGKKMHRLGDLQLRIMQVLWGLESGSVSDVMDRLTGEPLAYTTVATMLRKMEDRGLLRHRRDGRRFIYEPAVTAEEVTRTMADDLVDRLFEGRLADAVAHLLDARDVGHDELAELERLIQQRKRRV